MRQASCHPEMVLYCKKLCRKCYHHNYQKTYRKESISTRSFDVQDLPTGFYAYVWLRENGTPYYVGKGSHDRAYDTRNHRVHCPKVLERIVIYPAQSEDEAFETEIALIWYYGRKDLKLGCLRNLTDGGENPPKGRRKGQRPTLETREKIAKTLTGGHHSSTLKGKPWTEARRFAQTKRKTQCQ